jgi:hypothetical protein
MYFGHLTKRLKSLFGWISAPKHQHHAQLNKFKKSVRIALGSNFLIVYGNLKEILILKSGSIARLFISKKYKHLFLALNMQNTYCNNLIDSPYGKFKIPI